VPPVDLLGVTERPNSARTATMDITAQLVNIHVARLVPNMGTVRTV